MHFPPHRPMIPGIHYPLPKAHIPSPHHHTHYQPPMHYPFSNGPTGALGLVLAPVALILGLVLYFTMIEPDGRESERRWQEHKAKVEREWDEGEGKHAIPR